MSEQATELRNFSGEGSLNHLEWLSKRAWTGVARVRTDEAFGVVWFVKGYCVHAVVMQGEKGMYGWKALEKISQWKTGAMLLEKDVLPPERSIRLEQRDIWIRLKAEGNAAHVETINIENSGGAHNRVKAIQADMVHRFPGVRYLSTTHGRKMDQTGTLDEKGRSWVRKCLDAFSDKRKVKRLVVEDKNRILLMSKKDGLQTVVVANAGTDVQNLLNAVADMNTRVFTEQAADAETEKVRRT